MLQGLWLANARKYTSRLLNSCLSGSWTTGFGELHLFPLLPNLGQSTEDPISSAFQAAQPRELRSSHQGCKHPSCADSCAASASGGEQSSSCYRALGYSSRPH